MGPQYFLGLRALGVVVQKVWCALAMSLVRETNGWWTVGLMDWPDAHRSQLSVRAEAEIRKALKSDCGGGSK